jgi:hypothetical protein
MKLLGAKNVSELGPRFVSHPRLIPIASIPAFSFSLANPSRQQVNARMVERDIFDGDAGLDKSGLWTSRAKL